MLREECRLEAKKKVLNGLGNQKLTCCSSEYFLTAAGGGGGGRQVK